MITLFHSFFWSNIHQKNLMSENTHISILRVTRFIFRNLWIILSQLENENVEFLYDLIEYHCKYEKRNKRKNYAQKRINLSWRLCAAAGREWQSITPRFVKWQSFTPVRRYCSSLKIPLDKWKKYYYAVDIVSGIKGMETGAGY